MADYGVNIKVGVQGQNNAKQLGEHIREIVGGLEAADRAFTQFSNNLKSFDQRRAQRKINEELDRTAQKYRELDRLQRQLLANDNSSIKAAERRARIEEHISKNISIGRIRRQSARQQFLAGDPGQYPSGANQPFAPDPMVAIRKRQAAEKNFVREIFSIEQNFNRKLHNRKIDLLMERIKREMDLQEDLFQNALQLDKKRLDEYDRRSRKIFKENAEAARLTGQASPIGGAVGIPGSPAAIAAEERARRLKSAQGSALIGGAFPLLFGQGLGAAAGGAVGGFGGGMIGGEFGFGLSLVGTQLGSLFDQLIASTTELGQALNPLTADVDAVTVAAGLASTETAKFIQQLEEEAGAKAALEAATNQLALVIGTEGVSALQDFGDDSLHLSQQFSIAMAQMQSAVAKFLNGIGLVRGLSRAVESTNLLRAGLANTEDSELLRLQQERQQALLGATGATAGVATMGIDKQIVERIKTLRAESSEEIKKQAKIAAENNSIETRKAHILRDQLTIEKLGGSLLNDRVFSLRRSIIFAEAALEVSKDGLTVQEQENIFAERDLELQRLANDRSREAEVLAERKLKLSEKEKAAIERRVKAVERELERTDEAFDRASRQLDEIAQKHEDKMAFEREYSRLIRQGSTPAAAKQAIELKKQLLELDRGYKKLLDVVDAQILKTETSLEDLRNQQGVTTEYQDQLKALDELKKRKKDLEDKRAGTAGVISKALAPESAADKIQSEMDRIQEAINDLLDPANQVILAARAIGDAFSESFKGLITGSMTAQQALANFFQSTADHFADMAAQMIAKQIQMQILGIGLNFFSGGGHTPLPGSAPQMTKNAIVTPTGFTGQFGGMAALGGSVTKGNSYIVGERGPELFVPGAQGNIVPNNAMGSANVVVNVDASGTQAQGNQPSAKALGAAIGAAVQAELVRQKRPGGLLS